MIAGWVQDAERVRQLKEEVKSLVKAKTVAESRVEALQAQIEGSKKKAEQKKLSKSLADLEVSCFCHTHGEDISLCTIHPLYVVLCTMNPPLNRRALRKML